MHGGWPRAPPPFARAPLPCDGMTTIAAPSSSALVQMTRPTESASVEKRRIAWRAVT